MRMRYAALAMGIVLTTTLATMRAGSWRPEPDSQGGLNAPSTQPSTQPAIVGVTGEWKSYADLHAYILHRFVTSDDFGVRRIPRVNDDSERSKTLYIDGSRYSIGPVDLVSLNGGDNPFVYRLKQGGVIKDVMKRALRDAKHVPLPDPQAKVLSLLNDGRDLVLVDDGDRRYLFGAVHATAGCVHCHSVKEGTLIGAFRYPLDRVAEVSLSPR
jgi:hypothetical protein